MMVSFIAYGTGCVIRARYDAGCRASGTYWIVGRPSGHMRKISAANAGAAAVLAAGWIAGRHAAGLPDMEYEMRDAGGVESRGVAAMTVEGLGT